VTVSAASALASFSHGLTAELLLSLTWQVIAIAQQLVVRLLLESTQLQQAQS
jgi:hypothetical protein